MKNEKQLEKQHMAEVFGSNLSRLREVHGVSARGLAKELGCSHGVIQRAESGIKIPAVHVCLRIAEFFDVSLDDLVEGL